MKEFLFGYAVVVAVVIQAHYRHAGHKYKDGKQVRIESSRSFRAFYILMRIGFIPVAFLAMFRGILAFEPPAALVVAGIVANFLGAAVFVHAKTTLGSNYSPCFDSFAPAAITRRGVYRYVRHPIYVANFLGFLGTGCFTGSYLIVASAIILGLYYCRSARREEKVLSSHFSEYAQYQRQAGMFFPKIG